MLVKQQLYTFVSIPEPPLELLEIAYELNCIFDTDRELFEVIRYQY